MMNFTATDLMKRWSYSEHIFPIIYLFVSIVIAVALNQIGMVTFSYSFVKSKMLELVVLLLLFSILYYLAFHSKQENILIVGAIAIVISYIILNRYSLIYRVSISLVIGLISVISIFKKEKLIWYSIKDANRLILLILTLVYFLFTFPVYEEVSENYIKSVVNSEYVKNLIYQYESLEYTKIKEVFREGYIVGYLDAVSTYRIYDKDIEKNLEKSLELRLSQIDNISKSYPSNISVADFITKNIISSHSYLPIFIYVLVLFMYVFAIGLVLNYLIAPVSYILIKFVKPKV